MSNKYIKPSPKLIKFLKETSRLEAMKLKKLDKNRSLFDQVPKKTIRNNDEKKVRWLDNLFTSMANLIYFFEFINDHPEVIDKFGEDIEDLFGLNITDPKLAPFSRFIRAIIGEAHGDYDNTQFNFRIRLLKIMQFLISEKADFASMNLNDPPTRTDMEFRNMMIPVLKQAQLWMWHLDKFIERRKNPNRIIVI